VSAPRVPGIGPELSKRIHEHLHVETLEALEAAAHDGRLEQVPGFSARHAAMVRSVLAELLARVRPRPASPAAEPEAALLLDVDWMSIANTGRRRHGENCARSHRSGLSRQARLGCRS